MKLPLCHSVMELSRCPSLAADPIIHHADGSLTGGGNTVQMVARCTCGSNWTSMLTELQIFQGVEPEWKLTNE